VVRISEGKQIISNLLLFLSQTDTYEIVGACGKYGERKEMHTEFYGETRKEETTGKAQTLVEDITVDFKQDG
jgi:hypothetical protein